MLHDYSHVPSPMSPPSPDNTSNPHTPCSRDSHRLLSSEDTRCSTPDFTFEERVRPALHNLLSCRSVSVRVLWSDTSDELLPCDDLVFNVFNVSCCFQTVPPWERRCFPMPEDPELEPEPESDYIRPRMRSISGCRATAYGRLDSDDMDQPCDDDGGLKLKGSAHRWMTDRLRSPGPSLHHHTPSPHPPSAPLWH